MAVVFKARFSPQTSSDWSKRPVRLQPNAIIALKIANWVVANEPVLLQRFENEYRIAGSLLHPHLVRSLAYGVERDLPYLALEYVRGRSLDKQLKQCGPMPRVEALRVFGQIAQAVSFIHDSHLVHRDIKPGNILLNEDGPAKLADLGMLKDLEANCSLTRSRVGVGTLGFSAPEQLEDAKYVDCRCDIYSLAATLYFALTGKAPFGTGSMTQVMNRKLEHRFVPLAHLLPDIDAALDQVVIRALHPDPAMRPTSAEEFLAAIAGTTAPREKIFPKGVTEHASPQRNRRKHVRFPVGLAATVNALTPAPRTSLRADIVDVSAGGLSLISSHRFEPNTLLHVHLPSERTGVPSTYLVRTCWSKKLPHPDWLLGCSFLRPLANDDLDRLLLHDVLKTETFQSVQQLEHASV